MTSPYYPSHQVRGQQTYSQGGSPAGVFPRLLRALGLLETPTAEPTTAAGADTGFLSAIGSVLARSPDDRSVYVEDPMSLPEQQTETEDKQRRMLMALLNDRAQGAY